MKTILAGVAALTLISASALAQPATEDSDAPPVASSNTTQTTHAQDAYGNTRDTRSSVTQDSTGAIARDSQTTVTTAVPPPPPPTTTTTTTTQSTTTDSH